MPTQTGVKKWPTIERNELIYVWHHSDGADPEQYPDDFLNKYGPKLTAIDSYLQICYANFECLNDNGVDLEHFHHVHTTLIPYVATIKVELNVNFDDRKCPVTSGTMSVFVLGFSFLGTFVVQSIYIPVQHDKCLILMVPYGQASLFNWIYNIVFYLFLTEQ
ncbi:unnamed protein product, partial [Medioppia subpectinata]